MRECEIDNTPAPHSHLRPCDTNESHLGGKTGHNLDIFTSGCTHFCCEQFRHLCLCVEGTADLHCIRAVHYRTLY